MALTISKSGYSPGGSVRPVRSKTFSDLQMVIGQFVFDTAYVTGGESLTPDNIDLTEILFMALTVEPSAGSTSIGQTLEAKYDYDNQKVMAFCVSGADAKLREVDDAEDLSAWTVRFVAFGRK